MTVFFFWLEVVASISEQASREHRPPTVIFESRNDDPGTLNTGMSRAE